MNQRILSLILFLFPVLFVSPAEAETELLCNGPKYCGGFLGLSCEKDYHCVDIAGDGCDPKQGGSDCLGVCARGNVARASCPLTSVISPRPGKEERARVELSTLNSEASLVWSETTGTFQSVNNLDFEFANCSGNRRIATALIQELLRPYQNLFQFKPAEWNFTDLRCSSVSEDRATLVRFDRHTLGRHSIAGDYLIFNLRRVKENVRLESVWGVYLPRATHKLDADLAACPELSLHSAYQSLEKYTFYYSTFQYCADQKDYTYTPNQFDTIEFESERVNYCPKSFLTWERRTGTKTPGISFRSITPGVLYLGDKNVDKTIEQSTLNCPNYERPWERTYGYQMGWDTLTGEVVYAAEGIDCVVC